MNSDSRLTSGDTELPLVSVIVVAYNSAAVIADCLRPLVGRPRTEIIVWDNASTDDSAELVGRTFPSVKVVAGEGNLGFARAVNGAARIATGEALLLLNPDAVLNATDLDFMVAKMLADPEVGILAPKIDQPQGRLRVLEVGRTPTLWRMLTHWTGASRLAEHFAGFEGAYLMASANPGARDVDWVSGACMLVRGTAWRDLGGMTERWFMYAEDIEFCLRATRSGWRARFEPGARAEHVMGGSSGDLAQESDPTSVRTDWVVNLFDLYRTDIARHAFAVPLWRIIFLTGLYSRAVAYRVKSLRSDGVERIRWKQESRKFVAFAKALMHA